MVSVVSALLIILTIYGICSCYAHKEEEKQKKEKKEKRKFQKHAELKIQVDSVFQERMREELSVTTASSITRPSGPHSMQQK